MTKDIVTNRQLYDAIDKARKDTADDIKEIREMFLSFHEKEFEPLVAWKNQLVGKLAIGGVVLVALWEFVASWLKEKLFKTL